MGELKRAWCAWMRTSMCNITVAATAMAREGLSSASLQGAVPRISRLHPEFDFDTSVKADRERRWHSPVEEYTLYAADLAQLIKALLPLLEVLSLRLNAPAADRTETELVEGVLWELWCFLAECSADLDTVNDTCPDLPPEQLQRVCSPLQPVIHSLLTWLLGFTRSPAWLLMGPENGKRMRHMNLIQLLVPPATCLCNLSMHSEEGAISDLSPIPDTCLPLICCILAEQFCTLPSLVTPARPEAGTSASHYAKGLRSIYHIPQPLPNLLNVVVVTINNLAAESGGTGYPEELAFLNHPAVAHLLKLIVIMDPESRQPCRLNLMQDSIRGLSYLLYRRMNVDHAYLTKDREPKTAQERRENRDMDGLPLQLSAFCSEAALKTDALLLHALRKHDAASDTEEVTAWRYEVQGLMLKLWVNESKVFPSTSGQLMEMAKNVVGAAAECAVIGLQLLLAHKAETAPLQQQQQRREAKSSRSQQQQQRAAQKHLSALPQLPVLGWQGMEDVRGLMYLASSHQTYDVEGDLVPRLGEKHSQ